MFCNVLHNSLVSREVLFSAVVSGSDIIEVSFLEQSEGKNWFRTQLSEQSRNHEELCPACPLVSGASGRMVRGACPAPKKGGRDTTRTPAHRFRTRDTSIPDPHPAMCGEVSRGTAGTYRCPRCRKLWHSSDRGNGQQVCIECLRGES